MKSRIAIIDYGLGNLRSVSKALEISGGEVYITSDEDKIKTADGIVIPGVGAFWKGMENLNKSGLVKILTAEITSGKPVLAICLGLQMLFTESEEHGATKGMNIIKGKVKRFNTSLKIPHMGWNSIKIRKENCEMFKGIKDNSYFYFVHSYYVAPENNSVTASSTVYGEEFTSAVVSKNLWALQFHPEKSAEAGLRIMENFINKCSNR